MKCCCCDRDAEFKCSCMEGLFICNSHLEAHQNLNEYHEVEKIDIKIPESCGKKIDHSLQKRIDSINNAIAKWTSDYEILTELFFQASEQHLDQLNKIKNNYLNLHNRHIFTKSEYKIIKEIVSTKISIETINFDEIISSIKEKISSTTIITKPKKKFAFYEFLKKYNGGFKCGAITNDEKTLVTGGVDHVIRVFDLVRMKQKFILLGHNSDVKCIELIQDKYIASGSFDGTVRIWGLKNKLEIAILKGHNCGVLSICYVEKNSLIFSGDEKGNLICWDFKKHTNLKKIIFMGPIYSMVLMKTQPFIIVGEGQNLGFFGYETLEKGIKIQGHDPADAYANFVGVLSLALTSDERIVVSGCTDKSITVWDLNESKIKFKLYGHSGAVNSVALSSDDKYIVSGSDDKSVRVWDMSNRIKVSKHKKHFLYVYKVLRIGQGFISLGADSGVGRLESATRELIINSFLEPYMHNFVNFSTKSRFIGFGSREKALVWDNERNTIINELIGHKDLVESVVISIDCQFALSCSRGAVKNLIYWNLSKNKKIANLNGHTDSVFCVCFSKNGLIAASGSADTTVRLWYLNEIIKISVLYGHKSAIYSIKFIKNNKELVSGASENIIVWNISEKNIVKSLNSFNGIIKRILTTDDEKYLISGDFTNGVMIWDIENGKKILNSNNLDEVKAILKEKGIDIAPFYRFLKN